MGTPNVVATYRSKNMNLKTIVDLKIMWILKKRYTYLSDFHPPSSSNLFTIEVEYRSELVWSGITIAAWGHYRLVGGQNGGRVPYEGGEPYWGGTTNGRENKGWAPYQAPYEEGAPYGGWAPYDPYGGAICGYPYGYAIEYG
jgi:hypothetical protein